MSDKTLNQTYFTLLLFTGLTALLSLFSESGRAFIVAGILTLAVLKIFMVAFQFMELKHAHKAWKLVFMLLILLISLMVFGLSG